MENRTLRLSFRFVMAVTFLIMITGCTHIYNVPDVSLRNQGSEYVTDKKINLAVNLYLSDQLKAAKWEKTWGGETDIILIGNQLAKNATELCEIVFKDVLVTNDKSPAGIKPANATLTPRVVELERTIGSHAFTESIFTIVLEWKLEDMQNNVIWIDSIKGEGRANSGNMYNINRMIQKQTEILLRDLFGKSIQAVRASPEIRQFVAKKEAKQEGVNKNGNDSP